MYNCLFKYSKKYKNSTRLSVHTPKGRVTINSANPEAAKITRPAYLILDDNGKLLYADFSTEETCSFLCSYVYINYSFEMKDGSMPPRVYNKGVYNPGTFLNDYFTNSSDSKTVSNYCIKVYNVNLQDYRKFTDAKKRKRSKN